MRKLFRFFLCLTVALTLAVSAFAELPWPVAQTAGQTAAQTYVTALNADLTGLGSPTFNSLFEVYTTMAALGITAAPNAELPEDIQLTLYMSTDEVTRLTLGTSRLDVFADVAAACIHAAAPTETSLEAARAVPAAWAKKAQDAPGNSFKEDVDELRGGNVRCYYNYTPDLYGSGTCWITMDLIFPIAGGAIIAGATPPPATAEPTNAPDISDNDDPSVMVDEDTEWSMADRPDLQNQD